MSNFLSSLLAQQGCNVDGTVSGVNPVTAVLDRLFDTSTAAMMSAPGSADGAGSFAYYDAPPAMAGGSSMMGPMVGSSMEAAWAAQQSMGAGGIGMGMMGMGGMGGDPQQAQMMMMMQMQMQ